MYPSRAAAVRAGVAAITSLERRRALDAAVIEGYRRMPPTPEEHAAALASQREAIAEEPWSDAARSGGRRYPRPAAARSWS